jgi:hypothetical protein
MPALPLTNEDLGALRRAKATLDNPGLAMKLASAIGTPFEKLLSHLPMGANATITDATHLALKRCLKVALRTVDGPRGLDAGAVLTGDDTVMRAAKPPAKPHNWLHKIAVATTGAAGGAFGLFALPVELPLTTTLIFRSICEIGRSEGEDFSDDMQLQCLMVLGMGGASKSDDNAELGYFFVRGALAQAVSKASAELAAKGFASHGSAALIRLLNVIAARFSVQVTEQIAAKSIPVIGAVLGALVNTVFIEHFQQMARGHFTVRRLERKYGEAAVRAAYDASVIDVEPASR